MQFHHSSDAFYEREGWVLNETAKKSSSERGKVICFYFGEKRYDKQNSKRIKNEKKIIVTQ